MTDTIISENPGQGPLPPSPIHLQIRTESSEGMLPRQLQPPAGDGPARGVMPQLTSEPARTA